MDSIFETQHVKYILGVFIREFTYTSYTYTAVHIELLNAIHNKLTHPNTVSLIQSKTSFYLHELLAVIIKFLCALKNI